MLHEKETCIYVPNIDKNYRYVLGTKGKNPLFVIGINPSTGVPGVPDPTMKAAEKITINHGFDSIMMLNIYAQRATNPKNIDKKMNLELHKNNMEVIKNFFDAQEQPPMIWAAWGTNIRRRKFLKDCLGDLVEIASKHNAIWYHAGSFTKYGHPRHPLYLARDINMESFDIEKYRILLNNSKK